MSYNEVYRGLGPIFPSQGAFGLLLIEHRKMNVDPHELTSMKLSQEIRVNTSTNRLRLTAWKMDRNQNDPQKLSRIETRDIPDELLRFPKTLPRRCRGLRNRVWVGNRGCFFYVQAFRRSSCVGNTRGKNAKNFEGRFKRSL